MQPQPHEVPIAGLPDQYVHLLPRVYQRYRGGRSKVLGLCHMVLGVVAIGCNIGAIVVESSLANGGTAIWMGVFFIVNGIPGYIAGKTKTACPIITFMTLSITSSVFCVVLLAISAAGVSADTENCNPCSSDITKQTQIGLNVLLVCVSLCEFIVSVWGAAGCFVVACCCVNQPPRSIMVSTVGQTQHLSQGVTVSGMQYHSQPGQYPQYQQPQYPIQLSALPGQPSYEAPKERSDAPPPYSEVCGPSDGPQPGMTHGNHGNQHQQLDPSQASNSAQTT